MKRHDIGHVLKDLKVIDLKVLRAVIPVLVGLLQLRQVLEDVVLRTQAL